MGNEEESFSARGKFAIAMVIIVVMITIGMRIYRYFDPVQLDSIYVEDTMDYDQIEDSLFGNETVNINFNAEDTETVKPVPTVASERSDIPVLERVGTRTLAPAQEVQAVEFQGKYILALSHDNQLFLQAFSPTWEAATSADHVIDTLPALQRQLIATQSKLHMFSLRQTDAGYQIDVKQFNVNLEFESEFTIVNQLTEISQFTAAINADRIYVYASETEGAGTLFTYDATGTLLTERSVENYYTPVAITLNASGGAVLVTHTTNAAYFIKLDTIGNELSSFSISLEDSGYTIQNFSRWRDYVLLVGSFDTLNSNDSQILLWSENLLTRYPSIHFNAHISSPNIVGASDGVFLVYITSDTKIANATETTTYTVNVDQFQTVQPTETTL